MLQPSGSHQEFFERAGEKINYPKGRIMSWADDKQAWAYFLSTGHIRTGCSYTDGTECVVGYLQPGSTFSQSSAIFNHGGRIEMEFSPVQDCVLYRAKLTDFQAELQCNQQFMYDFLMMQLRDEMMMVDHIALLGERSLEQRFIRWLLMMAKFFGQTDGSGTLITVPQTLSEIAAWLNILRETAGKLMRRYTASGHILLKEKHLRIHDIVTLTGLLYPL